MNAYCLLRCSVLGTLLLAVACAPAAPSAAAPGTAAVDRTAVPEPGPEPTFDLPDVQRRTLTNGLDVWIVRQAELPLVTLRLVVNAGSVADPANQPGLASLTAAMLDEGTRTRSALEIADQIEFLGASLGTGAGYDASYVTLSTLARNLPAALEVFADVVTSPAFPETELERLRSERLTSILQGLDQPTVLASQQFTERIYGPAHPYGRPVEGTTVSVRGFQVPQMRRVHQTYYRPNNSSLIVVGDVSPEQLVPLLERTLGPWQRAEVPDIRYPEAPAPQAATRVYLIDKPGAAQSEIRIGHVGVARDNPDYFPLLVMNTILGGQFSSRINLNLREDKGYTYGARSGFSMRRQAGPFIASAGVQTPSTKESVIEFMRELQDIRASRPVTDEEIAFAKASIV
ncbi:MAG: insulinase family protein, partial [Gemmatimonadota bacterium]|nr:insulinase family protein [Gemmatimonadota bacterium]